MAGRQAEALGHIGVHGVIFDATESGFRGQEPGSAHTGSRADFDLCTIGLTERREASAAKRNRTVRA